MGVQTRAQLKADIIANLGNRTDLGVTGSVGDLLLNRALDRVQVRIARARPEGWTELKKSDAVAPTFTGVPPIDVRTYDIPAQLDKIKALMVRFPGMTRPYRITEMVKSQWDSLISDAALIPPGRILHYVFERDTNGLRRIQFYPPPNEAFTMYRYYTIDPTPFASDGAVSQFEDKDDLLVAAATNYMFMRFQQFEEADAWFREYSSQLQAAILHDKSLPDVHAIPRDLLINAQGTTVNPWQDPFVRDNRSNW